MGVSIQNPIATFNNALAKNTKYQIVRTWAQISSSNISKSEEKVKQIMKEFQSSIHNGSTGGINVRI